MRSRVRGMSGAMAVILAGLSGCVDERQALCADVTCEAWQQCEAGACLAVAGRCDTYLDCADDELCGPDHRCLGPTRPSDAFFDPLAGSWLTFEHRSVINAAEALSEGQVVIGFGTADLHFPADDQILTEHAYSYRSTVPPTYPDPLLAGQDVLGWGISRILASEGHSLQWLHVSAGVTVAALAAIKDAGATEAPLPESMWLRIYQMDSTTRAFDHAQFRRSCKLAEVDPAATDSRIFLSAWNNQTFAPGEDLLLWGNIGLTPPNVITPANEESLCTYTQDGNPISRDDYLRGLAQTAPELTCEIPAGFDDPPGPDYVTLLFTGPINDAASGLASFVHGLGVLTAMSDGEAIECADYYQLAYRYYYPPTDILIYQTVGGARTLGDAHYRFNMFQLLVARSVLVDLKASAQRSVAFDPALMWASLEDLEYKFVGTDYWYRNCPRLIADVSTVDGSLLVCHELNQEFAAGEPLEIAATVRMTGEASAIRAHYDISDECFCYVNSEASPVDCADFEAL